MDKQLIKMAVDETYRHEGFPLDMKELKQFVESSVARIDAERGKEAAAAWWDGCFNDPRFSLTAGSFGKEEVPLFLTPTIPEGMALVPISNATLYAWVQSLNKGVSRCQQSADQGDAETIEDVIAYLTAPQPTTPCPNCTRKQEWIDGLRDRWQCRVIALEAKVAEHDEAVFRKDEIETLAAGQIRSRDATIAEQAARITELEAVSECHGIDLRERDARIHQLFTDRAEQAALIEKCRLTLKFYADQDHFILADKGAWYIVSGEPQNLWEDDANTATVEDGHFARQALSAIASYKSGEQKLGAKIYRVGEEYSQEKITFRATVAGYYNFFINGRSFLVLVKDGQSLIEAAKESGLLTPAEIQFLSQG